MNEGDKYSNYDFNLNCRQLNETFFTIYNYTEKE